MKQIYYLFAIAIFSLCFTACNEEDKTDIEWRNDNLAAYEAIKDSADWHEIPEVSIGSPKGVYYKEIKHGEGAEHPIQTAEVKVNYTGYYFNDPNNLFDAGGTAEFAVNGVVRGFSAALQAMHVGDKWEICIPYNLGYGASGSTSMRGYTTLFFQVELLKITQYP